MVKTAKFDKLQHMPSDVMYQSPESIQINLEKLLAKSKNFSLQNIVKLKKKNDSKGQMWFQITVIEETTKCKAEAC